MRPLTTPGDLIWIVLIIRSMTIRRLCPDDFEGPHDAEKVHIRFKTFVGRNSIEIMYDFVTVRLI